MKTLRGKKILFFSVQLFGITDGIRNKMVELGADVDYYDERPSNHWILKSILKLFPSASKYLVAIYYNRIWSSVKNKSYDYFFLIKGEVIPEWFLEKICSSKRVLHTVYYSYDSLLNNPGFVNKMHFFDSKITFDRIDAIQLNISFLPLFFPDSFERSKLGNSYDLVFIGSLHSDRVKTLAKIIRELPTTVRVKYHIYVPNRLVYYFKRHINPSLRQSSGLDISFEPLDEKELLDLMINSRGIIDIHHPNQSGLTMRSIESVGIGRKLVTTNDDCKNYPFYSHNNIFILDRDSPTIPIEFLERPYEEIDESIYSSYTLESWLQSIFKF